MSQSRRYRASDLVIVSCLVISLFLVGQLNLLSKEGNISSSDDPHLDQYSSSGFSELNLHKNEKPSIFSQNFASEFLNKTPKSREDLLLVTQLSRAGSSSLEELLKELKNENHFIIIKSLPKRESVISIPDLQTQKEIAVKMSSINETAALFTSFAFIDFPRFYIKGPMKVSLIRDPVERAVSIFYYSRSPSHIVDRLQKFPGFRLPESKYFKKSLEKCLDEPEDEECSYQIDEARSGHTTQLFCGHEPFCRLFGNIEGLNQAKANVDSSFAVVGILEEWNKTLSVLEAFIPKFFRNATTIYYDKIHGDRTRMNKNKFRPSLDSWARKELRKRLFLEVDFYSFVRQRLHKQYLEVIRINKRRSRS